MTNLPYSKVFFKDYIYKKEYYSEEAVNKYLLKRCQERDKPNPAYKRVIRNRDIYDMLCNAAIQNLPQSEYPLALKTIKKFMVGQGGDIPCSKIKEGHETYYMDLPFDEDMARHIRETFFTLMDRGFRPKPLVINDASVLYRRIIIRKTSGSLLYDGFRNEPVSVTKAFRIAFKYPWNWDMILGEARRKDGKIRNVYNSPLSNMVREARAFLEVFHLWKTSDVDYHYSNRYLAQRIVSLYGAASYCGDYEAMDKHFLCKAVHLTVDMACDIYHAIPEERAHMHRAVDEFMEADVLVGDTVYIGLHNFLSGLYPTHDLECILNFGILATVAVDLGYEVITTFGSKLARGQVFIGVNGDDSYVIFGPGVDQSDLDAFGLYHAYVAGKVGQNLELSKCETSFTEFNFCKNTFALRQEVANFKHSIGDEGQDYPLPKYPLIKALHQLWEPENMPDPDWTPEMVLMWTCSILDDCAGCSNYKNIVNALVDKFSDELLNAIIALSTCSEESAYIMNMENEINARDWWLSECAHFSLTRSDTYIHMKQYVITRKTK